MINNLVQRYDKAGSKDMEIFTFTGYHQIPLMVWEFLFLNILYKIQYFVLLPTYWV